MLFLQIQGLGQRDVAVQMPLMKFIKQDHRHPAQFRIVDHLPQQDPFRHKPDPGLGGSAIFEPDLVAHLVPQAHAQFLRHPRRQQPRRQPPRLQDDHLSVVQQTVLEQHLRHLGGFAGPRGGG